MSENTGSHVCHALDKFNLKTSGFTQPGAETLIFNPEENGEGEICMRGRHVMMGYLNNEEKTIETIDKDGFLHTGDKGKVDENGFLIITGRYKELIVTAGGENIAPVGVEDKFKMECDACSNIMLVGE
jgi:long-chain-fatty-acid--CoA ligase ACSBG